MAHKAKPRGIETVAAFAEAGRRCHLDVVMDYAKHDMPEPFVMLTIGQERFEFTGDRLEVLRRHLDKAALMLAEAK